MSRQEIDDACEAALANGALGGKLTGAGGGGFLVVYASDPKSVRRRWPSSGCPRCGSASTTTVRRSSYVSEQNSTHLAHLYSELSGEGLLAGFEVDERFYEIGSPEGLGELERLLAPVNATELPEGAAERPAPTEE
jgi:GHMP kinases C terminal